MLVIISDLHFGDGSATGNIKPRAFELFYDHVLDLARHAGKTELTLLFLGDVFDLLRTEHWFYPEPGAGSLPGSQPPPQGVADPFPPELRPWGARGTLPDGTLGPECEARALQIADAILSACAPQLAILRGEPPPRAAEGVSGPADGLRDRVASGLAAVKVTRLYLPGNHDRLARVSAPLGEKLRAALGAEPAPEVEPGLLRLSVDGVTIVARHGHELDDWNFEPAEIGTPAPTAKDFRATPLGDVITTELLARLPYLVRQELVAAESSRAPAPPGQPAPVPRWIEDVYEHLKGIEDVRPLGAVVRWVVRSGRHLQRLGFPLPSHAASDARDAIDKIARHLVLALLRMEFTGAWRARRRLGRPGSWSVFLLRLLGVACRLVPLEVAEAVLGARWVAWLVERAGDGKQVAHARRLLEGGGTYAVLGHTHDFRHVALHDPAAAPAQVYLNSGTWRPRVYETRDRSGFRRVKEMTYLVFHGGARARYETWNGVKL